MGKLTKEDVADILLDAAETSDAKAARKHGTTPQNIGRMRDELARGGDVSGAGKVTPEFVRARLKVRIREEQLQAQLDVAKAIQRVAKEDGEAQSMLGLSTLTKTLNEVEGAHEWLDAQLAVMEEQRRKLAARETTHDEVEEEPRQLEAHEDET